MPLDIAAGIFISLLVAHGFGIFAAPLLILFTIICALLPDIDMLPILQRVNYDHRSFFHWPLLYVPFAIAMYFFFGPLVASIFVLGIFWHFIHDSFGIGWGVAWLAPFSYRKILFPETGRRREYGFFMTWLPEEEVAMAAKWHDPHWVRNWYFKPNLLAFLEYTALFTGILTLVVYYGTR